MKWVYRNELANNSSGVGYDYRLGLAAYAFAYVSFGDTYKPETRVEKIEMPKALVVQGPVFKGPVVRELPLEK